MKYVVRCEHVVIVEANTIDEAEEKYNDFISLYEEEEITSIEELPLDSIYNDYCE